MTTRDKILALVVLMAMFYVNAAYGANNIKHVRYNHKLVKRYLNELNNYSLDQLEAMKFGYNAAARYDLSYSVAAIIMEESQAGKQLLNLTGDYGLMGINIKYYLKDLGLVNNKYNEIEVATKLIRSDALNIHVGIDKLRYWLKKSKGNFKKAWGMYNGGYGYINYHYANRIYNRIKAIKIYERRHPYAFKDMNFNSRSQE